MVLGLLDRLLVGGEDGEAFEAKPEARPRVLLVRHLGWVFASEDRLRRQASRRAASPVWRLGGKREGCVGVVDREQERVGGRVAAGSEGAETGKQQRDECVFVERLDQRLGEGLVKGGQTVVACSSDRSHRQPPQVNRVQRHIGREDGKVERREETQPGEAPDANDLPLRGRLLERRGVDPLTGCWEWQGRRDRWGYGRITVAHRRYAVHRLSAALFLGFDLTSPLHILHRCHNPPCFRPDHLHPGSHHENMRERQARANGSL